MSAVLEKKVEDVEMMSLGFAEMDNTHKEFVELVKRLNAATGAEFQALFRELHLHTEMHFAQEHKRMKESGFPALAEHHADHERILGQMMHFRMRVEQGRSQMARAFVLEQLPDWFKLHLATMDSALVAHLKKTSPEEVAES